MALYDTSNSIDSSIFLKAKLDKNMVGTNYYIENLQAKRDRDWDYRYNVVNIEEELNKQIFYTNEQPCYTPIDVVIRHVKSEKGEELGTDWAEISFKNLNHPNKIGYRYRFSLESFDMESMSEEDKYYNTSIWIALNKSPINPGNSIVIRRCNSSLVMLGSPTISNNYITEIHREPCILTGELKYMQTYYNMVAPVPQAEYYATMQLNYFSNCIKIGDRFIFTTSNYDNRGDNQIYKVKAVIKSELNQTFFKDDVDAMNKTPLITIALDKDATSPDDDLVNKIADSAPIYKTIDIPPVYKYYVEMNEPACQRILLNQTENYVVNLMYNDNTISGIDFTFSAKLNGIIEKNWPNYFTLVKTSNNSFSVHNLKACNRGSLQITAKCTKDGIETSQVYEIELGGFY